MNAKSFLTLLVIVALTGCQRWPPVPAAKDTATPGETPRAADRQAAAEPLRLTADNFPQHVLSSRQPVVVDFWATWCVPCQIQAPVMDELAAEYRGQVTVAKLDIDEYAELAGQYGIESVPTLLFFQDGQVVATLRGVQRKANIARMLDRLLQKQTPTGT